MSDDRQLVEQVIGVVSQRRASALRGLQIGKAKRSSAALRLGGAMPDGPLSVGERQRHGQDGAARRPGKRTRFGVFGGRDPRWYQIAALVLLLLYGLIRVQIDVRPWQAIQLLTAALLAQYLCGRLWKLEAFEPKSALISGLSLCLLLRSNSALLATTTATVAIASKFVLRWNGKHVFNPTNLGLVLMLLCSGGAVWVSPGQWGDLAFFAFLVICIGGLVVNRASRADVTLAFLCSWVGLIYARSFWLGEPATIPLHRLQNGALLVFAFFMISDPKTTPDSRAGRIWFALLVASGAALVQFRLFRANGLLWSLAACSVAVPLIDRVLPGPRYQWRKSGAIPAAENKTATMKGNVYEPIPA